VKRMLAAVGHPVLKLKRVKFGPLMLGDLPPGEFRYLTDREANALRAVLNRRVAETGERASDRSPAEAPKALRRPRRSAPFQRRPGRNQIFSRNTGSSQPRPMPQASSRKGPSPAASGSASSLGRRPRPAMGGRDRYAGDRRQPNDPDRVRGSAEGPNASARSPRRAGQESAGPGGRRSRSVRGGRGPSNRGASPRRPAGFRPRARRRP